MTSWPVFSMDTRAREREPMAIVVTKVELRSVMDASGMAACIEAGRATARGPVGVA